MTRINYEDVKGNVKIEFKGEGGQLLHGLCRIASALKVEMKINDEEFIEAIKEGIEVCEIEKKINSEHSIDELLKLLDKMLGITHKESDKKDD